MGSKYLTFTPKYAMIVNGRGSTKNSPTSIVVTSRCHIPFIDNSHSKGAYHGNKRTS